MLNVIPRVRARMRRRVCGLTFFRLALEGAWQDHWAFQLNVIPFPTGPKTAPDGEAGKCTGASWAHGTFYHRSLANGLLRDRNGFFNT